MKKNEDFFKSTPWNNLDESHMKIISLIKRNKKELFLLVDDEDYGWLSRQAWHQVHPKGYIGNSKKQFIHRLILENHGLDIKGKVVDHINGNVLDNRKDNLRACSIVDNVRNHKVNNRWGYTGVHFNDKALKRKFQSFITVRRRHIFLGSFYSKEEAALAYNQAAVQYFGEYARRNEI